MPNLSVKDVPEAWAQALRQRAARNHRSLQGELMAIIEQAASEPPATASYPTAYPSASPVLGAATPGHDPRGTVVGQDRLGNPIVRRGWKTIEQLVAERRPMYPEPLVGFPSGTDMIREERDSR